VFLLSLTFVARIPPRKGTMRDNQRAWKAVRDSGTEYGRAVTPTASELQQPVSTRLAEDAIPGPMDPFPEADHRHLLAAIDAGSLAPVRLYQIGGNPLILTGKPLAFNCCFHVGTLARDWVRPERWAASVPEGLLPWERASWSKIRSKLENPSRIGYQRT